MQLAFDEGTGQLSVTITHQVADPTTHYVKRVLIQQETTVLLDTPYTSQPSAQTFTYTYPIPPEVAGTVEVKAVCSITGEISRTLQIARLTPTSTLTVATPTGTSPTPATLSPVTVTTTVATPAETAAAAPSPVAGGIAVAALGALAVLAVWWVRR
jgi:hypothetical protein